MKKPKIIQIISRSEVLLLHMLSTYTMYDTEPLSVSETLYHAEFTVEIRWLEHLWNHENMFETGVVRANEF